MRSTFDGTALCCAEGGTGRIAGAPCGLLVGMRGRGGMDAQGFGGGGDIGGDVGGEIAPAGRIGGDMAPAGRTGIDGRAALVGVAPKRCCRAAAEA